MNRINAIIVYLILGLSGILLANCSSGGGGAAAPQIPYYSVGGTVTGLTGTGLVVVNKGADNLLISAGSSTFVFSTKSAAESTYCVTASAKPGGQACIISNGTGTVAGANVTSVSIVCSASTSSLVSFVTSTSGSANMSTWPDAIAAGNQTGLRAADAVCQARAEVAGLSGSYKAWLSDDTNDAYCRMHGLNGTKSANCGQSTLPDWAGPWVRTDGEPFAEVISKLTGSQSILTPAGLNEYGAPSGRFWSSTDTSGVASGTYGNCAGWSDTASAVNTSFGEQVMTNHSWTDAGSNGCTWFGRLLCMQAGAGVPLTYQTTGKKVFKTSTTGAGNLSLWTGATGTGIAAGDSICIAQAAAASLSGSSTYKAWLSNSTSDAASRIVSAGPWIRVDGIKLAANKADLTDGTLNTTVTVNEFGAYSSQVAWTGSDAFGVKTTTTCQNWTDNTSGNTGDIGYSSIVYLWSGWTPQPCNSSSALYCFED